MFSLEGSYATGISSNFGGAGGGELTLSFPNPPGPGRRVAEPPPC